MSVCLVFLAWPGLDRVWQVWSSLDSYLSWVLGSGYPDVCLSNIFFVWAGFVKSWQSATIFVWILGLTVWQFPFYSLSLLFWLPLLSFDSFTFNSMMEWFLVCSLSLLSGFCTFVCVLLPLLFFVEFSGFSCSRFFLLLFLVVPSVGVYLSYKPHKEWYQGHIDFKLPQAFPTTRWSCLSCQGNACGVLWIPVGLLILLSNYILCTSGCCLHINIWNMVMVRALWNEKMVFLGWSF